MNNIYQIYLISDSTGETLDRIFLALKAQFNNFHYKTNHFSFTRTENQIQKILENCKKQKKTIILYTIVDEKLSNFLKKQSRINNIPCYGLLGDLIDSFSKLLNQNALNVPSRQHIMNDEYYKKIDAIQFTMNHDDGNAIGDIEKSDIILIGVSRTSKTPTSIYLANKGYKVSNIPIVNKNSIPENIKRNKLKKCIIGLIAEPERLAEIRKNRMTSLKETGNQKYTNLRKIQDEVESSRNTFIKFKWPTIDVSRKSVEETAASVIKIYEISRKNA
ncbi:kinase/pyrophosphorylase [Candidatus Pelagibacter sp.]|nr:kinase/pyrophosphorylase [Candidatus Pelagibacter sp.]